MKHIVSSENQKGEVNFVFVFDAKKIQEGKDITFILFVNFSVANVNDICYSNDLAAIPDDQIINVFNN